MTATTITIPITTTINNTWCFFMKEHPFTFHLGFVHPPQDVALHQCLPLFSVCCFSCFTFHLGFVHPLQDAALHRCLPLSSVSCFPVPRGSPLPCYVVLPPSTWSSPLISSLSSGATLCSAWFPYGPSFSLRVQPISTFVSVCIGLLVSCTQGNVNRQKTAEHVYAKQLSLLFSATCLCHHLTATGASNWTTVSGTGPSVC